jgi:hypothetical protein
MVNFLFLFDVLCFVQPFTVMASNMASLFEEHHLALQYLVPNLLKLYVDIDSQALILRFFFSTYVIHCLFKVTQAEV